MGGLMSTRRGKGKAREQPKPATVTMPPMVEVCATVAYKEKSKRSFPLTSDFVPHGSMGASAVLDGCPPVEDHDDSALFIM